MKSFWGRIKQDLIKYWKSIVIAIFVYIIMKIVFVGACSSVAITGFPCPACGLTRAAISLLKGHFAQAFNMNPSIYLLVALLIYIFVFRYVLGRRVPFVATITVFVIICLFIIFFIRMKIYFPNVPPLTFTRGSVFQKIYPWYYDLVRKIL